MTKLFKTVVALVLTFLMCSFASANAQLVTQWEGEGAGVCSPPPGVTPDFPIYAWQVWAGTLDNDGFYGKWTDEDGNYGHFKSEVVWDDPAHALAEGVWTWIDDDAFPFSVEYVMGKFAMKFDLTTINGVSYGYWSQMYTGEEGKMKGHLQ